MFDDFIIKKYEYQNHNVFEREREKKRFLIIKIPRRECIYKKFYTRDRVFFIFNIIYKCKIFVQHTISLVNYFLKQNTHTTYTHTIY